VQLGLRLAEQSSIPHVVAAATDPYSERLGHPRLLLFDPSSYGLGSDVLLFDTYELLGRMIHEHYVLQHALRPDGSIDAQDDDDPLGTRREWTALDPLWKLSNRRAAGFVVPNLRRSGLRLTRLSAGADDDARWFPGDDSARVEEMAAREHERWRAFMESEGFTLGPKSNPERRRPDLRPWADVPEATRAYTRTQVLEYPRLLAQLGFEIRVR
jgi:hypothetical protein